MHSLFWEDDRLFLNNGTVWGVYRLPQLPYEHQSKSIKYSIYRQLEVLFMQYHGKGQILSLTRPISKEKIIEDMHEYSDHEYWSQHVRAVDEVIEHTGTFERRNYLLLPLASSHSVAWDTVLDRPDMFSERIADQIKRFTGYIKRKIGSKGIPIMTEAELQAAKKADVRMFNRLQALIPQVERATPFDIEFLHRSPYNRGLSAIPTKLPEVLPSTISITEEGVTLRPRPLNLTLTDATVIEDTFRVRVKNSDGQCSYQSIMAAATMPEDLDTVGDEWLYHPLEHMEYPVDACIHFEIIPPKKARDIAYRRKKVTLGQEEEYQKVGDVPLDVYDGLESAEGLEAKLKAGMTLAQFHVFFAVGADTEMEMLRREMKLKERLDGIMQLVHPPGEALRLWQSFFPATTDGVQKSWMIPADPTMLACSGLLGTMQVGDPKGQWLGYQVYNQSPVFVDWFRAMTELNRTGAVACVGTLGSGKSVILKYGADTMLQWGAIGVIIDPKQGEYEAIYNLWRQEAVWWRFGPDSQLRFSPFRLGKDVEESKLIANGFLSVLLNITSKRDDQRASLVIQRALDLLYEMEAWDMLHFLKALDAERKDQKRLPDERELADLFYELLARMERDAVGRAIFGRDGEGNELNAAARLLIVSTTGLDFPDANTSPNDWRESQRFGVAILYLASQIGFRWIASAPAHVKKFYEMDEAWLMRSIPEGRALMNQMILQGRSMNLVFLMAVQNPDVLLPKGGEANDDLTANLGWIFVGRLISKIQIEHAVTLLGLPEDEDYTERFNAFQNGRGFLRDPLGRIGEIQVEVLPAELLQSFGSTPSKSNR